MEHSNEKVSVEVNSREAGVMAMSLVFYGVYYGHWCQECDDLFARLMDLKPEMTTVQRSTMEAAVHNLRLVSKLP